MTHYNKIFLLIQQIGLFDIQVSNSKLLNQSCIIQQLPVLFNFDSFVKLLFSSRFSCKECQNFKFQYFHYNYDYNCEKNQNNKRH